MDSLIAGNTSRCVAVINDILYLDWNFSRSLKQGGSGAVNRREAEERGKKYSQLSVAEKKEK